MHAVYSKGLFSWMYILEQQCVQYCLQARTTLKFKGAFSLEIFHFSVTKCYDTSKFVLRRLKVRWCECLVGVQDLIQGTSCSNSWSTLSELKCAALPYKINLL